MDGISILGFGISDAKIENSVADPRKKRKIIGTVKKFPEAVASGNLRIVL
jgi:hypothetical protein